MRKATLFFSLGLLCLLLTMLGCERHTTGSGGGGAGQVAALSITAADSVLATPAGVVDSTTITITVTDAGGNGVPGKSVELWMDTNVGILTALSEMDTTDYTGQVRTTFRVNVNFGANTIHARVDGITAQMQIRVEQVNIAQVTLQVDPSLLTVAPGSSGQATLKVWVRDEMGNGVAFVKPTLQSSIGIIQNYDRTDNSGKVETVFYSAGDSGTAIIIARVGAVADTGEIIINRTASATGTISLQATYHVIYADGGVTTSAVSALLKDADFQVIQGDTVIFTSTFGAIASPRITDSLGIARTVFIDNLIATEPDSAMIVGQYRPFGIADTIYIMILEQQPIDYITLSVNPHTLTAGVDSAEITATVLQVGGNFAPAGTAVLFASDSGGTFLPSNTGMLNESGQTTVTFYAPNASGVVHLTARASGIVSNEVEVTVVPGPVRRLDISVDPPILYTNSPSNAQVTVEVMDSLGNYVNDGILVTFSTTLGIVTPYGSTQNGLAYGTLNPGNTAGIAVVKAEIFPYADSTTVTFVAGGPSTIDLQTNQVSIQVAGVGGQEQALMTATVRDAMSNIIEDGWPVVFSIENNGAPGGGININNRGIVDTSYTINGAAVATLNSGSNSGPVLIKALTWTDSTHMTEIFALKSGISVVSGPPENIIVEHNNEGTDGGGGNWIIDVVASVSDVYNNPVRDGTVVFFTVVPDTANIEAWQVATGNVPFSGGSAIPGNAYSQLSYNGSATFEEVTVTASASVPGSEYVRGEQTFPLPLQSCEVALYIQPIAWHFNQLGNPTQIECSAVVLEGHGIPVNNALVLFFATKGRFYTAAVGGIQTDERLTGQPPDPPGEATLWLRAELQYTFFDQITPEVTGTVNCSVYGYPACVTDGQQILFQRFIGD